MTPCPICKIPSTSASSFCEFHQDGWIKSIERGDVDWTDNDSYEGQVVRYAERFTTELGEPIQEAP